MTAIIKRELHSLLTNITGYIFCGFVLLFAGIFMTVLNLKQGIANFEYAVGNMGFIFLIGVPLLTMRTISEERKQRTDTLLYSLPISMTKIVIGKYIALLILMLMPVVLIAIYPLILKFFGNVYLPASYGTLLGFFFLGAALMSIGVFISSVTDSQAVAAILCLIVLLINYYLPSLASFVSRTAFGGALPTFMEKISLFQRFYDFPNGVLDISSLVFFAVVAAVFLYFTVQSMEKRRWS